MGKKDFWILGIALAAALILVLSQFVGQAVPTVSWGLSFRQEGQPPSAPDSPEALQKYGAAFLGNTEEKVLYLTFDAGYENGSTEKILKTLEQHGVQAAFFLCGNYIEKNPDLVRQMVDQGHTVCNHTMHHPDMSKLDREAFEKELRELEDLFRETTGGQIGAFYRPPQGIYSQENLQYAQQMGYRTVFWSLAYADWDNSKQPTKEQAFDKLLPRTHNGAVILLHSTSETNAAILDELLTAWEQAGYTFQTLEHLFSS